MAGQNMGQQRAADLHFQELCEHRSRIVESIKNIRIEPFKTIRQVEVSEATNSMARAFVKSAPNVDAHYGRYLRYCVLYSLEPAGSIYELLARDAGEATVLQADQKFKDWEEALNHLRRYAFNLLLAPKRPEFQSIKLYSSFYVYQVTKKLNGAEKILMAMGYRVPDNQSSRDADELRIEGEVDLDLVADAAADLVILQQDLKLLRGIAKSISGDYSQGRISEILEARSMKNQVYGDTYDDVVTRVRSGLMLSPQTSPTKGHFSKQNYNGANSGYYGNGNEGGVEQERRDYNRAQHASSSKPKRPNTILPFPNETLISRSAQIEPKNRAKGLTQYDSAPLLDTTPQRQPDVTATHSSPGRSKYPTYKKSGSEGNLLDRVNGDGGGSRLSPRQPLHNEGMWEDQHSNPSGSGGIRSRDHVFSSPSNLEESFSVISNCGNSPPPNPEDLPEPVFTSEAAIENNQYERHLRYSYSGHPPWLSPEISPYVEEDPYKPLQPLQPDPSHFANSEESVHCNNGSAGRGDSTSAHTSDRHPGGYAGEDSSTVEYTTVPSAHTSKPSPDHRREGYAGQDSSAVEYTAVVCHNGTSRPSCLPANEDDPTVVYSTVMHGTSQPSNHSDVCKSSHRPDGYINERERKGAPNGNHERTPWRTGDCERVSGQNGYHERVPGQKSPPKSPQRGYGQARTSDNAPRLPPKSSNTSKSSIQSNENSKKDSSSMNTSTLQNGSQPQSARAALHNIGKGSSNLGQDPKTAYRETELDGGFLSIDLVSKSSPARPRASHISEPSKVDYEDKLKADKANKDNDPAKNGDLSSGSESNLDFQKRTKRSSSWICDYCTFINTDADECEVCGILRKSN